jgi:type I restriction enzyme S subunit
MPFEIPLSWQWIRLHQLCKSIADGDHQPPPQVPAGIPFLVISNVSSGQIDLSNTRHVPQTYFEKLQWNRIPSVGDLLFTVTGSYGIVLPVRTSEQFCFQRHIALIKPIIVDTDFLSLWLSTPLVYEQCRKQATGTAQKTVGLNTLRDMLIPLPPYREQLRIVSELHQVLPYIQSISPR